MKYLSICSGIEAASVAFEPLGWRPLAFSEIEAFPRAVLKHHYPDTPCHGDFTLLKNEPWIVDADLLCGGTPCQAFSVAGNRQSLADDRGNLTLQFVLLADAIDHLRSTAGREPAWILWENVPGVLSTKDNAFGAFLGGLVGRTAPIPEPADGWTGAGVVDGPTRCAAWRILDAQHFGLAQRRKRVFVLARGGAGRWAVADALLPIIEGSKWHPAPGRGAGKDTAEDDSSGTWSDCIEGVDYENNGVEAGEPMGPLMKGSPTGGGRPLPVVAFAQNTRDEVRYQGDGDICGTLAAEPGMKQTTYIAFDPRQIHHPANHSNPKPGDPCHPLRGVANCEPAVAYRVGEHIQDTFHEVDGVMSTLSAGNNNNAGHLTKTRIGMQVRRLTPVECERLQGFPDGYTNIPWRGKPESPDGPRYKALGNSWAVPCARWIGERIKAIRP
jgi:DNA (cytosine-5)-methyltransferase 1